MAFSGRWYDEFARKTGKLLILFAGGLLKVVINYCLVANRGIHIVGAPIGTLASYAFMAVLNFVMMCFVLDKNPRLHVIQLKPLICTFFMAAAASLAFALFNRFFPNGRIGLLLAVFPSILAAVAVYLLASVLLRTVTKEDMALIPGGAKIAGLLHMK